MGKSTTAEPNLIVELVPGKLYRLGGVAPILDSISWIPKGVAGWVPLNCYLLPEEESVGMVNTGLPINADVIAEQLRRLVPPEKELRLFLTRYEPETVSNLPLLTTEFDLKKISGGGVLNPFDFFDDLSSSEQLRVDYNVERTRLMPGDAVVISPTRKLELVVTTLRLLTTFWAYDAATKTLFTSDSFGHAQLADPSEPAVITAENDTVTLDQVRDHLLTKFEWLKGADTEVLVEDLTKIFDDFDVEIIAPDSGKVLQGRDVVARHVGMVVHVLSEIKN